MLHLKVIVCYKYYDIFDCNFLIQLLHAAYYAAGCGAIRTSRNSRYVTNTSKNMHSKLCSVYRTRIPGTQLSPHTHNRYALKEDLSKAVIYCRSQLFWYPTNGAQRLRSSSPASENAATYQSNKVGSGLFLNTIKHTLFSSGAPPRVRTVSFIYTNPREDKEN